MEKKNTQQQDITSILKRIEQILQSDAEAKIEHVRRGPELITKITIEDNRFHNIEQLIKQIKQKNNKNYRKLIELISDYIGPIYDKKDFDQGTVCSVEYYDKQSDANHKFVEQLFNYICKILTSNPNISLNVETLKKLLKKRTRKELSQIRLLDFKELANILRQNKTLQRSEISTSETYQILIETFQLRNKEVFTALITQEQFNENHELIDKFLKICNAYDFVNITDIIKKEFDPEFNESALASKNTSKHFVEDLIYYLIGNRRKNEERDYALMHTVLSDKNRTIDFHTHYDRLENEDIELYIIIQMFGNQTIIKDMIEHPNAKDIYGFNSIMASLRLFEMRCHIGEYEKFLDELNQNKGAEYLSQNNEIDSCFKQTGYIELDKEPENLRTYYISKICDSLKSQNIDYNRIIHIISLIINDDNLNYFEPDYILPKLQELLSEEDFKDLLNVIAQKQKEGKLTLIEWKQESTNNKYRYIINKISVEEFERTIKEYIGHKKSIGTYPTAQNDDSQDD